jgi:hypothetical protein
MESRSPIPIIHCAGKYSRREEFSFAVAALVATTIETVVVFGVPAALIVAGVKAQVASEGSPAQASVMLPLKLVEFETVTEEIPVLPGTEIKTCDALAGIEAKKPGVMVKVIVGLLVLALKLPSPLYAAEIV